MYLIQIFVASLLFIGLRGQNKIKPSPQYCAFLENEEFAIDIKRCQNTCSCYGRKWDCDSYRPQGDCYCKDGFARSYENGPCVDVKLDEECAAMLPISPDSCLANEEYIESLYGYGPSFSYGDVNPCGNTCEQRGLVCSIPNTYTQWGPRCECENGYLRTISGKCVAYDDPECVVEYAPSTVRCPKYGKVYAKESVCTKTCYGGSQLCYGPSSCICPEGSLIAAIDNDRCLPADQCFTSDAIVSPAA